MSWLGFFIDNDGKISRFGRITPPGMAKTERIQIHDYSFYDQIENTDYFRNLNLQYHPDAGLYGKAFSFSLQGIIMGFQESDGSRKQLVMYVPVNINDFHKSSLKNLYSELTGFKNYHISICHELHKYSKYDNLQLFYQDYGIFDLQDIVVSKNNKSKK